MGITVGKLYDPSAVQFLGAIQNRDYTIGKAINELVIDLKNYALWNKMKAIYPMVGQANISSSFEVNLKDVNTFRGVFSGSWTFSSMGILGDGSTTYMNTKIRPNIEMSFDSQHYCVYKQTNVTSRTYACDYGTSLSDGPNSITFYSKGSTNFLVSINDNFFTSAPTYDASGGAYILNRIGTTRTLFRNSSVYQSVTLSATNSAVPNLHIGARNDGSNPARDASDTTISFFSAGDGLTDTEAANLYTAVQRFQTTLGRQV